jgi:GTP-dependent phosphoenolpyruvate carboxykinase
LFAKLQDGHLCVLQPGFHVTQQVVGCFEFSSGLVVGASFNLQLSAAIVSRHRKYAATPFEIHNFQSVIPLVSIRHIHA